MTEALWYRSTGSVRYQHPVQHDLQANTTPAPRIYRPRRCGPGRISIRPLQLADLATNDTLYPKPSAREQRSNFKLAAARENAKRFLRSVIAPPSNTDHTQAGQTRGKRRSVSPTDRAQSVGGNISNSESTIVSDSVSVSTTNTPSTRSSASMHMRNASRTSLASSTSGPLHRNSDARHSSYIPTSSSNTGLASLPHADTQTSDNDLITALNLQDEKPIAAGNGVTVSVHLAEPVLFLQGFENGESAPGNTAMLRGNLHVRVTKTAKIKAITLKFKGKAVTRWPEGIPPRKVEFEETNIIMSHTWPFFNAQFESAEKGTNADHVQLFRNGEGSTKADGLGRSSPNPSMLNLSTKDARRLSLQVNHSRSFGKGDSLPGGPTVAAKGYRTFLPGDYVYNFELPIDSRLPESIDVELGSVKYDLEASIERSGAFRANLVGSKELTMIRAPAEGSLEQVEPIAISRNWEDQLHYDIVISGKSFPLGSKVPIAFKLTPLAKVQCHRIKVMVTENIEYFCSNKRVHRMEPTRKVQLFEKRADGPPISAFPGSTMSITSGGGIPYDQRARAAAGEDVTPIDSTNLLGPLTDPDNQAIGPTEMEFAVQLPSCHAMKERERPQRLHFDTTYQNIQVHHWIKIVMRLSKPDADNPAKRRHFEISIDSPFHILSCRATQANISLPAYSSPQAVQGDTSHFDCGCPGAARRRNSPQSLVPTLNSLGMARGDQGGAQLNNTVGVSTSGLTRPQMAHVHGPSLGMDRPMHLLRAPSFNPPAFEDDAPPPLITPPPQYNDIASPTNGLADYFSRLSDAYDDEDSDDDNHRAGRVNIPLTPGGRVNRSMDLGRPRIPVGP